MNERIILVYPNFTANQTSREAVLPVGLGYIAQALQNAGIEYSVIDLNIDSTKKLFGQIRDLAPDFIGISMLSYRCKDVYALITEIEAQQPDCTIVVGGPHVSANREKVLAECPEIDLCVMGEGEETIVEVVSGQAVETIKGIFYRKDGEIHFTGARPYIKELGKNAFPTYEGFHLKEYGNIMRLESSRGCPYKCIFCGAPGILGRKWRYHSPQEMMTELRYWHDRGYRQFCFADSNLAVNKERLIQFCNEVIKSKLQVTFVAEGLRADHVNEELLAKMKDAGFTHVCFGVEAGSDRILKILRKGETRQQIESAIAAATKLELNVTLFFLINSPGETVEDVRASFALAKEYDVAYVWFFNVTPLPGTQLYEWALEHGFDDSYEGRYPEDSTWMTWQAKYDNGAMTAKQVKVLLQKGQKIKRIVEMRYSLRDHAEKLLGKKLRWNRRLLNVLAWTLAFRSTYAAYRLLVWFVKLVRKRAS